MKFSVLISLYDAEQPKFLYDCLTSLAIQTLPASEVVMVFDGIISSELEQVVLDFQAALNINIVRLPENVGLGKALNIGITHCLYEYIFRMDSDDVAVSHRFEKQCAYLIAHPEIALLGGQIAEFDTKPDCTQNFRIVPETHEQIIEFSKKRNPFNHMTVAYKKSAVQQAGGYQHHLWMEDYNLWLRMLAQNMPSANLPETLVLARTGNDMIKRRRGWKYIKSEWQLFKLKKKLQYDHVVFLIYHFIIRGLVRVLPFFILKKIYAAIRSPFKIKQMTLNFKYIIIGLLLNFLVLLAYLSQKNILFYDIKIINSLIISYISYIFSTISLSKLRSFPGNQSWLYVLPTIGITYSLVFGTMGILFVTFSNSFVFASGILSAVFFSYDFWVQQKQKLSIAYIPCEQTHPVERVANIDWIKLSTPVLPNMPIQAVVVNLNHFQLGKEWNQFLVHCALLQIPVYNMTQIEESLTGRVKLQSLYGNALGSLLPSQIYMQIKYILDIFLIILSFPITLPIILITAIAIKLESVGPVLFMQNRVGLGGKEFKIYKFRSMANDSEKYGAKMASIDDMRVTKVGKLIRKVRIDELPQFLNVLKGEMSLIGPRPEQKTFVDEFDTKIPFYNYRHIVKPGISGWAQVTHGYAADVEATQVKIEYDFYYIKHFSFYLDVLIFFKTIKTMLTGFGSR